MQTQQISIDNFPICAFQILLCEFDHSNAYLHILTHPHIIHFQIFAIHGLLNNQKKIEQV